MKRIICTVTNDLSYDQRMIRICSTLAENGYDILLIGRKKKQSIPLLQYGFQQKRLTCWFQKGKLFYLEFNLRLFFYLLFARYDAICSIDLDSIIAGYALTRLRNKKWVYDAHELFTELPELVGRPRTKKIWSFLERKMVPKVDKAYTVCKSLSTVFYERYQVPFSVIRNVPFEQTEVQASDLPEKGPIVLLYQGVLNVGRGLESIIEVIAQRSDCILWIAGEGDIGDRLRKKVDELSIADKVIFKGYVTPSELKSLTSDCHIGINLLENLGLNYYYSLANKCFDYIQAGKPSLNMSFPEYRTLQDEFDIFVLVDDLTTKHLHWCIDLLKDPALYRQKSRHCIEAARILTWENEKTKLVNEYNQLFNA